MQGLTYREATAQAQRAYLIALMQQTGGDVGIAARFAGMDRSHFYRVLNAHSVPHAIKRRPEPGPRLSSGHSRLALYQDAASRRSRNAALHSLAG